MTTTPTASDSPTIVGILWMRRRFLIRFVSTCLLLTVIGVVLWPDKYDSSVSLMPPTSNANSLLTGLLSTKVNSDLGGFASAAVGLTSKADLYVGILSSRSVQDPIIDRFNLRKEYHDKYMKDARKDLARNTEADEDRKSGIITITVSDRDKYRAAAMAAAYVQELNRVSLKDNNTSAHLQRAFLEQRLGQVNQDLKDLEAQLAQFSSKNMTFDSATQGKALLEAGTDLQAKLIAQEAELSGLRQNYAESNPRVKAMEASVSELRNQLSTLGSGTSKDAASGQIYPSLRELPLLGVGYEDLTRRVKIEAEVSDILTQDYETAKIEEAKELPVVQVLDPPDVAERHSSPRRSLIIAASLIFYLALGTAFVVLEAHWRELDPTDKRKLLVKEAAGYLRQLTPGGRAAQHNDLR